MSQLFQELKRRNVFRVAIAYVAIAWLILQVSDIVLDNIAAPAWLMQALMFFLAIGFPVAILFAWAYEMTPEGIKREKEVDRSASITHETGQKLNRTIIAVLVVAVTFLLVDKFVLQGESNEVDVTDKSVAVLPFVAMSRGPDDEYFADGLTEEILNSLTRVPELLVTARTSAFHFKGQDIPVPEIAATLGVAHVVEGSVRRDGDRLRVTAQLIRADDGFHLWSKNYDRETVDTFGVQTDIAEKIASALNVVLDQERLTKMHAAGLRDPEAFVAYQKGIELFDLGHGDLSNLEKLQEANFWFERALSLAPGISDAYIKHSDYFVHLLLDSAAGKTVSAEQVKKAATQSQEDFGNAIRSAPDEATRLAAAFDQALVKGNWRSLQMLADKIVATPGCVGPGWFDMATVAYGHAESALAVGRRLIECDPLNFAGWTEAVQGLNWSGDFEESIRTGREGLMATPHPTVVRQLVIAYLGAGRYEEAETLIDTHDLRDDVSLRLRLKIAASQGHAETAASLLEEYIEYLAEHPVALDRRMVELAVVGKRDLANKSAAEIDARPYGHLVLMIIPRNCMCGAPWDLEVTPNFAKLLDDASLPWPPASPINWPLKSW